jgi:hypothetical protein
MIDRVQIIVLFKQDQTLSGWQSAVEKKISSG